MLTPALAESLESRVFFDALAIQQPPVAGAIQVTSAAPAVRQGTFALQDQNFAIEFDATPTEANENVAIGLSLGEVTSRAECAAYVLFGGDGTIQVRDGSVPRADAVVPYTPGQTYRFTLLVNVPQHTYTVTVQQHGSATPVLIANGYAFRPEQTGVGALTSWRVLANRGDAVVRDVNLSNSRSTPRVALPAPGKLYHGVFPAGEGTQEDDVTPAQTDDYEAAAGAKAAWIYFGDNWFDGQSRAFPTETATWIRDRKSIPYIRLTTTSDPSRTVKDEDPVFGVQHIIDGDFDADLRAWAEGAKAFGSPVLVEWGTEANGDWFNWNGRWNGAGETTEFGDPAVPDGPERFVAAYQHIVQTMRSVGAYNVTWVWHVYYEDSPGSDWNRMENYYPGPEVVDWIGVSAYGPKDPTQNYDGVTFQQQMDSAYGRLRALAPDKPVVIAEFGAAVNNPALSAQDYADPALTDLLNKRWKNVIGFSWWNERWQTDKDPTWDSAVDTDMRVQDSPELSAAFSMMFDRYDSILQTKRRTGPMV